MKQFRSLLLASACITGFIHITFGSDSSLTEEVHHETTFQMGFEVETSGIKVQHDNEDEILVILESTDGKWQLTSDTKDRRIDGSNWVNLECRTVGGLTQSEICSYTQTTKLVMAQIKKLCDAAANGQTTLRSDNFASVLDLDSSDFRWGLSNPARRQLDYITFASKRPITEHGPGGTLHIMTTDDECLSVFVYTKAATNSDSKIGVSVKLAEGKLLPSAESRISEIQYKVEQELQAIAAMSSTGKWDLDAFKIAHLLGCTLSGGLFKATLPPGFTVSFSNTDGVFASLDCTLRPQLSFSFPTRYVSDVFMHTLCQEHEVHTSPRICRVSKLLSDLDVAIAQKELYIKEDSEAGTNPYLVNVKRVEKEKQEKTRDALKELIDAMAPQLPQLLEAKTNAHNLCLLVTEYLLSLFVLNFKDKNVSESGPKAFLKVVSRVPFFEMFNQLTPDEQIEFERFFSTIPISITTRPIKPYLKDTPSTTYEGGNGAKLETIGEGERITFLEWLKSISEPTERGAERVKRDLLSPPRFTEKEYSMGAVPIAKIPHLHTLIEARGYCDVEITSPSSMQHRQPISIDNVDKLINDEAGKFFTLAKGEVK